MRHGKLSKGRVHSMPRAHSFIVADTSLGLRYMFVACGGVDGQVWALISDSFELTVHESSLNYKTSSRI
jgi:hypothetical protein